MLKMGIIGAKNSHALTVARLINIDKCTEGLRVTHIWGETRELAQIVAEKADIENIVNSQEQMISEIDCVMICHRDGKYHIDASIPFVKARIPVFIDKPIDVSSKKVEKILELRKKYKTPITSFSAITLQASVKKIKKELRSISPLRSIHIDGPGTYNSEYNGIFFYGIHQVNLLVEFLGGGVETLNTFKNGEDCTVVCNYANHLTATLNFFGNKAIAGWRIMASGEKGSFFSEIELDDNKHLAGTKCFSDMFKTGEEPFDDCRMLEPIKILEKIAMSLKD